MARGGGEEEQEEEEEVVVAAQQIWTQPMQRVQDVAAASPLTVPPKYVRPAPQRASPQPPLANLPVIDISALAHPTTRNATLHLIAHACKTWGVFHAVNHGISPFLIQKLKLVSKEFFHLASEEKEVYANKPGQPVGYGSHLGVSNNGVMDWSDYFYHVLRPFPGYEAGRWPANPPAYREVVTEYGKQIFSFLRLVLSALAEVLRMQCSSIEETFGGTDGLRLSLRINHYPPCPQPGLALGLSPHSDPGILTALLQDEVGLQVRKDGTWYSVEALADALVVNVADQLEILSNGSYNSVEHQVVPNTHRLRMSWAMFLSPALDSVVSPALHLVDEQHPPLYQASNYVDYLSNLFIKGNKGKDHLYSHSLNG